PPDPERLRATRPLLDRPTPRLKLGRYLAGVAHAAIDVSDGLLQDLGHVLQASHCGAELWMDALPAHPALAGLDESLRRDALLAGGDAYELCFTARPLRREQIQALGRQLNVPVARVGTLVRGQGVRVLDGGGRAGPLVRGGLDIFPEPWGGVAGRAVRLAPPGAPPVRGRPPRGSSRAPSGSWRSAWVRA